jgi:hypothetical protein
MSRRFCNYKAVKFIFDQLHCPSSKADELIE